MFVLPSYHGDDSADGPVTGGVLCISLMALCVWIATGFSSEPLFTRYGFIPAHPRILTAMTSMFLHAGFWHIAGNLWFLYMFGRRVERSLGTPLFVFVYLASGLAGTALHFAFNRTSAIPCVGASGAISGIIGCFFVLFPHAKFDLEVYFGWWRVTRIPAHTLGAVGAWLGEQILLGLLSQAGLLATVAFWAHVGGFVLGALSALVLKSLVVGEAATPFTGRSVMSKSDIARLDLR